MVGVVAVLAAAVQAALAASAAAGAAAASCWVYFGQYGAALIMALAANFATSSCSRSRTDGDVPESARAARSGAHQQAAPSCTSHDGHCWYRQSGR